jgi:cytochrome P450
MTANEVSALTPTVPKPDHIPDALVYDFDLWHDPALNADPGARLLDLAQNAPPVFWSPRQSGHWFVASFEAAYEAARNWENFSSESIPYETLKALNETRAEGMPHIPTPFPICLDPPMHVKYRQPLNAVFSPKAMSTLQGTIREQAIELIEAFKRRPDREFMRAVAEPLPVTVFLNMMGLPLDQKDQYRQLVMESLPGLKSQQEMLGSTMAIAAAMRDTFIARREQPKDDLISLLWKTQIDGRPMTLGDMENVGVLLFLAGLDTVIQAIGFGVRHLAIDTPTQEHLRTNPGLITSTKEELMRRYSFTNVHRHVTRDMEFYGAPLKKGDWVLVALPIANLDPKHFEDSGRVHPEREEKVHISFGTGPHRCLGSHLARYELQIIYEELLKRMPSFRLNASRPPTFHGGSVIGVSTLHLDWDA